MPDSGTRSISVFSLRRSIGCVSVRRREAYGAFEALALDKKLQVATDEKR